MLQDKYVFEIIYESDKLRSTTTKFIIENIIECDDFCEAWNKALEKALRCSLPDDYGLVTIHYKGVK